MSVKATTAGCFGLSVKQLLAKNPLVWKFIMVKLLVKSKRCSNIIWYVLLLVQ